MRKKFSQKKRQEMIRMGVGLLLLGILLIIVLLVLRALPGKQHSGAAELAGDWMIENQNEYFLHAEYKPYTKEYSPTANPLAEMKAMWALSELGKFSGKKKYTELAEKGFSFFERAMVAEPEKEFLFFNITPQKIRLGYNSFAILTLLNIEHKKKDEYLEKLAKGILSAQNANGSFSPFLFSSRTTEKDTASGQALLALMSLYEETGKKKYMIATQKSLPTSILYWEKHKNIDFSLWNIQAYTKLFHATQVPEIRDFVLEMAEWTLSQHNSPNGCNTFSFALGAEEGKYIHALATAYPLAKNNINADRLTCYKNFISEGILSLNALQIKKEGAFDKKARGGFLADTGKNSMSIDDIQESLLTFLATTKIGIE